MLLYPKSTVGVSPPAGFSTGETALLVGYKA
jgi:hypothetical protein